MQPPSASLQRIVILAIVLGSTPAWVCAGPVAGLETLFYTPAERQSMTLRRSGQVVGVVESATRLTGVVHRANGKGSVWVNGNVYPEGSPDAGVIKGTDAVVGGRRLRVGEGIDTATGARVDIVQPGAVTPGRKP